MEQASSRPVFTITVPTKSITPAKQKAIKAEFEALGFSVIFIHYDPEFAEPRIVRYQ